MPCRYFTVPTPSLSAHFGSGVTPQDEERTDATASRAVEPRTRFRAVVPSILPWWIWAASVLVAPTGATHAAESGVNGALAFVGSATGPQQLERDTEQRLVAIDGPIFPSGSLRQGPFDPVADTGVGEFRIEAQPGADLRTAPASLTMTTSGGGLTAVSVGAYGKREVDPFTGRPLSDLDGFRTGSAAAFASLCDWAQIPTAVNGCWQSVFNSLANMLTGERYPRDEAKNPGTIPVSAILANALAGNSAAGTILRATFGVPIPFVRLNADPCDAFRTDGCPAKGQAPISDFGSHPTFATTLTLNEVLTDEQEALLGCGSDWGSASDSDCEVDGIRLFWSEAGALVQSALLPEGRTLIDGLPLPGTVGFSGEPMCLRAGGAGDVILPGCHGPVDPDPGYDSNVDGTTAGLVIPTSFGASAGQQFNSEMAALSFNFQLLLAARSSPPDANNDLIPDRPSEPDEFDPTDPFSIAPGQCSFAQPRYCYLVLTITSVRALEDDPLAPPARRWGWELGAEYAIDDATGDLAAFAGGTLHILGPAVPPVPGDDAWLGFLVVPAPEPGPAAAGVAALLALGRLARRGRVSPRRRRPLTSLAVGSRYQVGVVVSKGA